MSISCFRQVIQLNHFHVFQETFSRVKLRILNLKTVGWKIMFILQNFSRKISQVPLSANSANKNVYATRISQSNEQNPEFQDQT